MNSNLRTADRATHLKIVGVSLLAALAVIGVGYAASRNADTSTQIEARAPVLKPGKTILMSINEASLIR